MEEEKKCDLCQNDKAIYICYDCPNYYCDSCCKLIHNIKNGAKKNGFL